jgi:hypothetical protein
MPTQSFSSFEAFFDANRHASLRAMVLGPERGSWNLTNLLINRLSVQFAQAGTDAVVEGSPQPGGVSIFLLTQGLSAMSGNGQRFDEVSMLVAQPGDEFCIAADSGGVGVLCTYPTSCSPGQAKARRRLPVPCVVLFDYHSTALQGLGRRFNSSMNRCNVPLRHSGRWRRKRQHNRSWFQRSARYSPCRT